MNRLMSLAILVMFPALIIPVFAQVVVNVPSETSVPWISKNSADTVTINNGNGNKLTITINVDKNPSITNPPGLNVNNCGNTTHIDAGSSSICTTSDANNPVSFRSDSPTYKVTGTYIIKQE